MKLAIEIGSLNLPLKTKDKNILSEKQSEQILARLTIPSGKKFSPEEVQNLLELESLPAPPSQKKKPGCLLDETSILKNRSLPIGFQNFQNL